MMHPVGNCIHPPGSGHQEKIWDKALGMKNRGIEKSSAKGQLREEWEDYYKDVLPAVDRAVERVYSGNLRNHKSKETWPEVDEKQIKSIAEAHPFSLEQLRAESPYSADELSKIPLWGMLQMLFPEGSLLCMGSSVESFSTRPAEEFADEKANLPLIVPRTMSDMFGFTREGAESARCNDNVGPERFVVIEFDDVKDDVQLSMIKHLSGFLPLVLVLHSGGKSFHAWFNGCDASEGRVLAFRRHAACLGADKAVFTRSQMVRMPNQTRPENDNIQELHYFDHAMLPSKAEDKAVIDFDELPLAPEVGFDPEPNEVKERPGPVMLDWREFDANCPPEPPELVSEILHEGSKMVIGGHSKSYKSWLALQLAVSVSSGREFLGFPTAKSPVCYLNLELRDFAVRRRIRIMTEALELELEEGQFHIVNARGKWHGVQSLEAMVPDLIAKGVKLLFIDPIYKFQPFDENNTAEVGSLLQSLDRLVEETGAALVYVHHYRKSGGGKAMDMLSGSGVFARDFDSMIGIEWQEPSQKGVTGCGEGNLSFVMRSHPPKDDMRIRREHPLIVEVEEPDDHTIGDPPQES